MDEEVQSGLIGGSQDDLQSSLEGDPHLQASSSETIAVAEQPFTPLLAGIHLGETGGLLSDKVPNEQDENQSKCIEESAQSAASTTEAGPTRTSSHVETPLHLPTKKRVKELESQRLQSVTVEVVADADHEEKADGDDVHKKCSKKKERTTILKRNTALSQTHHYKYSESKAEAATTSSHCRKQWSVKVPRKVKVIMCKQWQRVIMRNGCVTCPVPSCTRKFSKLKLIRMHYMWCMVNTQTGKMKCPFCEQLVKVHNGDIAWHVRKHHNECFMKYIRTFSPKSRKVKPKEHLFESGMSKNSDEKSVDKSQEAIAEIHGPLPLQSKTENIVENINISDQQCTESLPVVNFSLSNSAMNMQLESDLPLSKSKVSGSLLKEYKIIDISFPQISCNSMEPEAGKLPVETRGTNNKDEKSSHSINPVTTPSSGMPPKRERVVSGDCIAVKTSVIVQNLQNFQHTSNLDFPKSSLAILEHNEPSANESSNSLQETLHISSNEKPESVDVSQNSEISSETLESHMEGKNIGSIMSDGHLQSSLVEYVKALDDHEIRNHKTEVDSPNFASLNSQCEMEVEVLPKEGEANRGENTCKISDKLTSNFISTSEVIDDLVSKLEDQSNVPASIKRPELSGLQCEDNSQLKVFSQESCRDDQPNVSTQFQSPKHLHSEFRGKDNGDINEAYFWKSIPNEPNVPANLRSSESSDDVLQCDDNSERKESCTEKLHPDNQSNDVANFKGLEPSDDVLQCEANSEGKEAHSKKLCPDNQPVTSGEFKSPEPSDGVLHCKGNREGREAYTEKLSPDDQPNIPVNLKSPDSSDVLQSEDNEEKEVCIEKLCPEDQPSVPINLKNPESSDNVLQCEDNSERKESCTEKLCPDNQFNDLANLRGPETSDGVLLCKGNSERKEAHSKKLCPNDQPNMPAILKSLEPSEQCEGNSEGREAYTEKLCPDDQPNVPVNLKSSESSDVLHWEDSEKKEACTEKLCPNDQPNVPVNLKSPESSDVLQCEDNSEEKEAYTEKLCPDDESNVPINPQSLEPSDCILQCEDKSEEKEAYTENPCPDDQPNIMAILESPEPSDGVLQCEDNSREKETCTEKLCPGDQPNVPVNLKSPKSSDDVLQCQDSEERESYTKKLCLDDQPSASTNLRSPELSAGVLQCEDYREEKDAHTEKLSPDDQPNVPVNLQSPESSDGVLQSEDKEAYTKKLCPDDQPNIVANLKSPEPPDGVLHCENSIEIKDGCTEKLCPNDQPKVMANLKSPEPSGAVSQCEDNSEETNTQLSCPNNLSSVSANLKIRESTDAVLQCENNNKETNTQPSCPVDHPTVPANKESPEPLDSVLECMDISEVKDSCTEKLCPESSALVHVVAAALDAASLTRSDNQIDHLGPNTSNASIISSNLVWNDETMNMQTEHRCDTELKFEDLSVSTSSLNSAMPFSEDSLGEINETCKSLVDKVALEIPVFHPQQYADNTYRPTLQPAGSSQDVTLDITDTLVGLSVSSGLTNSSTSSSVEVASSGSSIPIFREGILQEIMELCKNMVNTVALTTPAEPSQQCVDTHQSVCGQNVTVDAINAPLAASMGLAEITLSTSVKAGPSNSGIYMSPYNDNLLQEVTELCRNMVSSIASEIPDEPAHQHVNITQDTTLQQDACMDDDIMNVSNGGPQLNEGSNDISNGAGVAIVCSEGLMDSNLYPPVEGRTRQSQQIAFLATQSVTSESEITDISNRSVPASYSNETFQTIGNFETVGDTLPPFQHSTLRDQIPQSFPRDTTVITMNSSHEEPEYISDSVYMSIAMAQEEYDSQVLNEVTPLAVLAKTDTISTTVSQPTHVYDTSEMTVESEDGVTQVYTELKPISVVSLTSKEPRDSRVPGCAGLESQTSNISSLQHEEGSSKDGGIERVDHRCDHSASEDSCLEDNYDFPPEPEPIGSPGEVVQVDSQDKTLLTSSELCTQSNEPSVSGSSRKKSRSKSAQSEVPKNMLIVVKGDLKNNPEFLAKIRDPKVLAKLCMIHKQAAPVVTKQPRKRKGTKEENSESEKQKTDGIKFIECQPEKQPRQTKKRGQGQRRIKIAKEDKPPEPPKPRQYPRRKSLVNPFDKDDEDGFTLNAQRWGTSNRTYSRKQVSSAENEKSSCKDNVVGSADSSPASYTESTYTLPSKLLSCLEDKVSTQPNTMDIKCEEAIAQEAMKTILDIVSANSDDSVHKGFSGTLNYNVGSNNALPISKISGKTTNPAVVKIDKSHRISSETPQNSSTRMLEEVPILKSRTFVQPSRSLLVDHPYTKPERSVYYEDPKEIMGTVVSLVQECVEKVTNAVILDILGITRKKMEEAKRRSETQLSKVHSSSADKGKGVGSRVCTDDDAKQAGSIYKKGEKVTEITQLDTSVVPLLDQAIGSKQLDNVHQETAKVIQATAIHEEDVEKVHHESSNVTRDVHNTAADEEVVVVREYHESSEITQDVPNIVTHEEVVVEKEHHELLIVTQDAHNTVAHEEVIVEKEQHEPSIVMQDAHSIVSSVEVVVEKENNEAPKVIHDTVTHQGADVEKAVEKQLEIIPEVIIKDTKEPNLPEEKDLSKLETEISKNDKPQIEVSKAIESKAQNEEKSEITEKNTYIRPVMVSVGTSTSDLDEPEKPIKSSSLQCESPNSEEPAKKAQKTVRFADDVVSKETSPLKTLPTMRTYSRKLPEVVFASKTSVTFTEQKIDSSSAARSTIPQENVTPALPIKSTLATTPSSSSSSSSALVDGSSLEQTKSKPVTATVLASSTVQKEPSVSPVKDSVTITCAGGQAGSSSASRNIQPPSADTSLSESSSASSNSNLPQTPPSPDGQTLPLSPSSDIAKQNSPLPETSPSAIQEATVKAVTALTQQKLPISIPMKSSLAGDDRAVRVFYVNQVTSTGETVKLAVIMRKEKIADSKDAEALISKLGGRVGESCSKTGTFQSLPSSSTSGGHAVVASTSQNMLGQGKKPEGPPVKKILIKKSPVVSSGGTSVSQVSRTSNNTPPRRGGRRKRHVGRPRLEEQQKRVEKMLEKQRSDKLWEKLPLEEVASQLITKVPIQNYSRRLFESYTSEDDSRKSNSSLTHIKTCGRPGRKSAVVSDTSRLQHQESATSTKATSNPSTSNPGGHLPCKSSAVSDALRLQQQESATSTKATSNPSTSNPGGHPPCKSSAVSDAPRLQQQESTTPNKATPDPSTSNPVNDTVEQEQQQQESTAPDETPPNPSTSNVVGTVEQGQSSVVPDKSIPGGDANNSDGVRTRSGRVVVKPQPSKNSDTFSKSELGNQQQGTNSSGEPVKRKRGRPRRSQPNPTGQQDETSKSLAQQNQNRDNAVPSSLHQRRGRGRPPKVQRILPHAVRDTDATSDIQPQGSASTPKDALTDTPSITNDASNKESQPETSTKPADSANDPAAVDSYKCGECQKTFQKESSAKYHVLSEHAGMAKINDDQPMTESEKSEASKQAFRYLKYLKCPYPECKRKYYTYQGWQVHVKYCGKEPVKVTCEICGTVLVEQYYSIHKKMKHPIETSVEEKSVDKSAESSEPAPKRQSAISALKKFKQFLNTVTDPGSKKRVVGDVSDDSDDDATYDLSGDNVSVDSEVDDGPEDDTKPNKSKVSATKRCEDFESVLEKLKQWQGKFVAPKSAKLRPINSELRQKWREEMKNSGVIQCQECGKEFLSDLGMEYHWKRCGNRDQQWKCNLCGAVVKRGARNMLRHLQQYHKDGNESDAVPVTEKRSILEKPGRNIPIPRKTPGSSGRESGLDPYTPTFEWTLERHKKHLSNPVFPEWITSKRLFLRLTQNEYAPYIPHTKESASFKIKTVDEQSHQEASWQKLQLFENYPPAGDPCHQMFFVGGPVYACSWCPTPVNTVAKQYVAVASCLSMDVVHPMTDTDSERGLLQFWDIGLPSVSGFNSNPCLALALAHGYGVIWDMDWCPGGAWEDPEVVAASSMDEVMPRLGLLALACGDGHVRILSIPHPEFLHDGIEPLPVHRTQPVAVLEAPGTGPAFDYQMTSCGSVSWLKTEEKDHIAGGYRSGLVCVWNLKSCSPLLIVAQNKNQIILRPIKTFHAHGASVSSVKWSPIPGGRFLATGSFDRSVKIWDLDDTSMPIMVTRKGLITDIAWCGHWNGVFAAMDECYNIGHTHTFYKECGYYDYHPRVISAHNSCTWAIDVSDWLNAEASSDHAGEVIITVLCQLLKNVDTIKQMSHRRMPVYRIEWEPLSGETHQVPNNIPPSNKQTTSKAKQRKSATPRKNVKNLAKTNSDSLPLPLGSLQSPASSANSVDAIASGSNTSKPENAVIPNSTTPSSGSSSKANASFLETSLKTYKSVADSYGLVFNDSPVYDVKQIPQEDLKRLVKPETMNSQLPNKFALSAIYRVKWNPNLGSHLWLFSIGQSGIGRISCLAGLHKKEMEVIIANNT